LIRAFTPHSLEQALETKNAPHQAVPVAGGTDVMVLGLGVGQQELMKGGS
jgi:CO/xanthine dehydrogenase FAD-binding subunit